MLDVGKDDSPVHSCGGYTPPRTRPPWPAYRCAEPADRETRPVSATIMLAGNVIARIDGGSWATHDTQLTQALETIGDGLERPIYDPDPDLTEATYVAEQLNGKVIAQDPPGVLPEGAVW